MGVPLKERNRAEHKRYKEDVEREGKSFFPYAIWHDTLMSLLVVAVIIALACIWYYTADATEAGILGALILVSGMAEGFTGYLLPWDNTAYWATVVGININATGPFVGPFLAQFLQGGLMIGPDTLPKFYALHMLVLPGAIMALIGLHLYLVVRLGVTSPPWSKTAAGRERGPEAGAREGLIREPATEGDST